MSELSPLPIESARDAGRDLRVFRLGGAPALAAPGQCVMVRAGGQGPAPFAAASKPGEPFLELLVKRAPGVAEALWGLKPGDAVHVGPPCTPGYDIASHKDKDLFLLAAGCGLGPVRSVVRTLLGGPPEYGTVRLYIGVRTPEDLPFAEEYEGWLRGGIELYKCFSRFDPSGVPGGDAYRGYVQDVLRSLEQEADFAAACLCGPPAMEAAARAALLDMGMPEGNVLRNV
ncbi:MAG: hypothetical protein K8I02_02280 [Candidatus Methylomirabilis sp.]|nr:hypothetical protein [Deltaproteobacteria bacterium]